MKTTLFNILTQTFPIQVQFFLHKNMLPCTRKTRHLFLEFYLGNRKYAFRMCYHEEIQGDHWSPWKILYYSCTSSFTSWAALIAFVVRSKLAVFCFCNHDALRAVANFLCIWTVDVLQAHKLRKSGWNVHC